MGKFYSIFLSLILLAGALGLLLPLYPIPVQATDTHPLPDKVEELEYLDYGETRISPYATVTKTRTFYESGQMMQECVLEVSALPQTLLDLKTEITVEWRYGKSNDGVSFWETGNNIYRARVTGTRVSAEYRSILSAWDPILKIGGTELTLIAGPRVVTDPYYDTDYGANTVEWVYEKSGGLFEDPIRVLRYLRQIEGSLQEFYVIEENPKGTFTVENNYQSELGFRWHDKISAFDSNGLGLKIEGSSSGKSIDAREFGRPELEYPIIVDPTSTFTSSYYDGWILGYDFGEDYDTIHDATSGDGVRDEEWLIMVGQAASDEPTYWIYRSYLMLNMGSPTVGEALEEDAITDSAKIQLYIFKNWADRSLSLRAYWDSSETYPGMPMDKSDYNKAYYNNLVGSSSSIAAGEDGMWVDINIDSGDLDCIDYTGYNKFCIRTDREADGLEPVGDETVNFYAKENGGSLLPRLVVTFHYPTTKPVIETTNSQEVSTTSYIFGGVLVSDGGADTSVRFEYGTSLPYPSYTPWQDDVNEGEAFTDTVSDLVPGSLYHWTAKGNNAQGESDDDDKTFLTRPLQPSTFTATPGSSKNDLSWTLGTGSDTTHIEFSTVDFPGEIGDGTAIYDDSGVSYEHSGLDDGTSYYYSAWGNTTEGGYQKYSLYKKTDAGTPETNGDPIMTTLDESQLEQDSALLNGNLDALMGAGTVACSFVWGEVGNGFNLETSQVDLSEPGPFSRPIDSLDPDTAYECKAKGVGYDAGVGYGEVVTFTTGEVSAPTVTIQEPSVSGGGVTLWLTVEDDGGAIVEVWFQYGKTLGLGSTTTHKQGLWEDGQYWVTLENLEPDEIYYAQAVGHNSGGYGYSNITSFETEAPDDPDVTTLPTPSVGGTYSTLLAQVTDDGGATCEGRFQWGTNSTLPVGNTTESEWQSLLGVGEQFDHYLTGLNVSVTYYYRAQIQHGWSGVINGSILSFTTVFEAPEDFIVIPISSTSIGLTWKSNADHTLIVARIGSYPADRSNGDPFYKGPGGSTTYDGLIPGTTYYFRAWSWMDDGTVGGNYTEEYAEDATSTLSGTRPQDVTTPADAMNQTAPEAPSWFWQDPTTEHIQSWPLISYFDTVAEDAGWDSGYFVMILFGVGLGLLGAGVGAVMHTPWAVMLSMGAFGVVLAKMQVMPGWIIAIIIVAGIGIIIAIAGRQGGN